MSRSLYVIQLLAVIVGVAQAQSPIVLNTSVVPKIDEELMGPCNYEITIPQSNVAMRAVWVIFDRGREVLDLYNDPEIFRFAERERVALLLARHCRSKEREDMDVRPEAGIGRALFRALDQLGQTSKHGELQYAKVIVFGFSGAGSLVGRLPAYAPDRVLAAIPYAPGQYEPLGMDTIALDRNAANIPQLIIANAADPVNGTKRPINYFKKYFDQGAPWVLAMQNGVPHHGGLANAKPLMLAWLESILNATPESTGVTALAPGQRGGWWLYLQTEPTQVVDEWKTPVDHVVDARIEKVGAAPSSNYLPAGWVTSRKVANEWLTFVKKSRHNINSKYQ